MKENADADRGQSQGTSPVDVDILRRLVELMGEHDLMELEYEVGELAIRLSKRSPGAPSLAGVPAGNPAPAAMPAPAAGEAPAAQEKKYLEILSPMVGSFYAASGPDAKPFVAVGAEVHEDTVVCLIEAMKVFNEIKSGVSGRIVKVCVENEDTVDYGQVLFLVEPM